MIGGWGQGYAGSWDVSVVDTVTAVSTPIGNWNSDAAPPIPTDSYHAVFDAVTDGAGKLRIDLVQSGGNFRSIGGLLVVSQGSTGGGAIPEPVTMCALGLAVAGLGGYIRKRRRA